MNLRWLGRRELRRFPGKIHHFRGTYGRAAALLVACVARHTALLAHLGGPLAAHPVCTTPMANLSRKSPKKSGKAAHRMVLKANGAAFDTYGTGPRSAFRLTSSE